MSPYHLTTPPSSGKSQPTLPEIAAAIAGTQDLGGCDHRPAAYPDLEPLERRHVLRDYFNGLWAGRGGCGKKKIVLPAEPSL